MIFRFTICDCIWFPHPCSLWFCASVLIPKLQWRFHRNRPTTRRPSIVIPAAVRIGPARSIGRAVSMKSPLRPFFRLNTEPSPCDGARGVSREVGFAHTASVLASKAFQRQGRKALCTFHTRYLIAEAIIARAKRPASAKRISRSPPLAGRRPLCVTPKKRCGRVRSLRLCDSGLCVNPKIAAAISSKSPCQARVQS